MPSCQVCLLQLPVMDADAMAGTNWSTMSAASTPPGLSKAAPGSSSSSALLASVALSLTLGHCWWPPAVHTVKRTELLGRVAAIYMTMITAHQLPRTTQVQQQPARMAAQQLASRTSPARRPSCKPWSRLLPSELEAGEGVGGDAAEEGMLRRRASASAACSWLLGTLPGKL
jgi:hypothetical protein